MSPIRFVIVTHKRSGTHMLSSSLERHPELGKIYELFNLTNNAKPPTENRAEEIARRLESIKWSDNGCSSGFILHFDQDSEWGVLDYLRGQDVKYVCLTRLNQLARAVSIAQVKRHSMWQCHNAKKIPECQPVLIKPSELSNSIGTVARDWDRFAEMVRPEDRLLLTYEDLCQDTPGTIRNVCEFLGVDYEESMVPRTVKTTTKPLTNIVTNFGNLWKKFKGQVYDHVSVGGSFTAPAIKLVPNPVVGTGQHHSGWPFAVNSLRPYSCDNGMLFDDYVDRSFGYQKQNVPYFEPWVGIVHHPTDASNWVKEANILPNIVNTDHWKKSKRHLKGLICLSDFSREQIREHVSVPLYTVRHPIQMPTKTFSWDKFAELGEKRILQLGYYCRNTLAITQLPEVPGFIKTRVWNNSVKWINARDRHLKNMFSGKRPYLGKTEHWDRLTNDEYEDALAGNIIFLELFTASANNVVVECIVRNTPLVVNRHPAVEEYLGKDYPLLYDDFEDAPKLFTLERLREGHEYLVAKDKTPFTAESFVTDVMRIVDDVNS